jgi:hypothetical protein
MQPALRYPAPHGALPKQRLRIRNWRKIPSAEALRADAI